MRIRALALVPVTVLGLAGPAVAQAPTPAPTPTPTPTPTAGTPPRDCPTPLVAFPGGGVDAGEQASISVGPDTPGSASEARTYTLTRHDPAPVAVVREVTGATSTVFTVRLGQSHSFTLSASGTGSCRGSSTLVAIPVRPVLSIAARRSGPRDYAFTGRVLPGRGQDVALYRVTAQGSRVLTATTVVRPDGTYRIDRRFTGSGRFGFVVRVAGSSTNLAGESRVRPTVVH